MTVIAHPGTLLWKVLYLFDGGFNVGEIARCLNLQEDRVFVVGYLFGKICGAPNAK